MKIAVQVSQEVPPELEQFAGRTVEAEIVQVSWGRAINVTSPVAGLEKIGDFLVYEKRGGVVELWAMNVLDAFEVTE